LGLVCALPHPGGVAAGVMPIQGDWRLDERASKNVPDSLKGVDLKIWLKGKDLYTQRLFEGAIVGEPFVIPLDGVPIDREIAKGQKGKIQAQWKANGKLLEQIVKTTAANFLAVTQTTLITVSEDGKVMTRVQTTIQGSDTVERVLIYRRKD
jgi:hypothetical protein